jgi:hypothetical protein
MRLFPADLVGNLDRSSTLVACAGLLLEKACINSQVVLTTSNFSGCWCGVDWVGWTGWVGRAEVHWVAVIYAVGLAGLAGLAASIKWNPS